MFLPVDGSGDRRRLLLRGLTQSLPEILSLLYNVSVDWIYFLMQQGSVKFLIAFTWSSVNGETLWSCLG